VKTLRTLTGDKWSFLISSVSKLALKLVKEEWEKLTNLMIEVANASLIDLSLCTCELLARYGLPCKHHLLPAYQTGQPLPRSLLHPRWWLDRPIIKIGVWQPSYGPQQQLILSPKRNNIAEAALGLLKARETLGPKARSRLNNTFIQSASNLLQAVQRNDTLAQLPIGMPDAIPKRTWKKKKTHGLADAAGLTAAVIAQKELTAKEKAEKQAAIKAAKATALASAKAKAGKGTPRDPPASEARIDITHVSDSESEVDTGLPSSTAPPRLEDPSNMKRTRGKTLDFVALHTGGSSKKTKP
jgi:hypothetical protein